MSELIRLSSVVGELKKSINATSYIRDFKAAVKGGQFPAVELAERFRLPPTKPGKGERRVRETPDFAMRNEEAFQRWHESALSRLSASNKRGSRGIPLVALESGQIAFEEAAERTRHRLLSAQVAATKSRARKQKQGGGEVTLPAPEASVPAAPIPLLNYE